MPTNQPKIIFPPEFEPTNCPVHVRNEILINASPEKVWNELIRAKNWHKYYFNSSKVDFLNETGEALKAGTKIKWKTFGASLISNVEEFVPYTRLAWNAKGIGVWVYHAWLLVPTATGCHLITEESQHGFLCRLGKIFMPNRMYNYHQIWLEKLKERVEK